MRNIGKLAIVLAVLGILAVVIGFSGARLGLWEPIDGFLLYRQYLNPLGFFIAGCGLIALIIHLKLHKSAGAAAGGLFMLVGLGCLAPMILAAINTPHRAPPIHDISTDTENPPLFEVLDESRPGAQNSLEYEGEELAKAQAAGYPDIAPLLSELSPELAFERALQVADDMGWAIADSDSDRLRFEATARTPVFYFADDIVVAVKQDDLGSRVDMRGVSRVGRGDQGKNAARIEDFQERFVR